MSGRMQLGEIADKENVQGEYRYICTLEGVQLHVSGKLIEKTEALNRWSVR